MDYSRQPLAQRTSIIGSGPRALKLITEMGQHSGYSSGVLSPLAQNAATTIKNSREREKKEISDLNDRLAGYIEKVRFLEAQNRKTQADLEALSGRLGKDTHNIRQIYESELKEAQKLINETNQARDEGLRVLNDLNKEVQQYAKKLSDGTRQRAIDKDRIAELSHKLSNVESEINFYQRRIGAVDDEIKKN
ncbi:Cytoplasmic intermediate filament protein [Aphelenchoides bicaudatus]|nr:Cytoplasmic intermediate filament protein [Aphelenchoides bicaudatus]